MQLWLLTLLACAYPAEDFAVDMADAVCGIYDECGYLDTFGFTSADECATTVQQSYDPEQIDCAEYDKKKAEECVDGVIQMSCQDLYDSAWPTACDERCGYAGDGTLDAVTD